MLPPRKLPVSAYETARNHAIRPYNPRYRANNRSDASAGVRGKVHSLSRETHDDTAKWAQRQRRCYVTGRRVVQSLHCAG